MDIVFQWKQASKNKLQMLCSGENKVLWHDSSGRVLKETEWSRSTSHKGWYLSKIQIEDDPEMNPMGRVIKYGQDGK